MEIMKLIPTGKDYLWGGTRLREEYGKKIDLTPLAETWECSVHPDGPSYVANGIYKGQTLAEVLNAHSEYLGTKVENGELPVLVKFIDAKKDLSVQVHPDDVYAREHEGDNGKTDKLLFLIVFLNFVLTTATTPFTTAAYIKNRLDITGIIKIIAYLVDAGVMVILFINCTPNVWFVGMGSLAASVVTFICTYILSKKLVPELVFNKDFFSVSKLKNLVGNGIWNSLNSLGNELNSGLDLIISNLFLNGVATGQIAVVKTIGTMFSMLYEVVYQPFQPNLIKAYASGDVNIFINEQKKAMRICGYFSNVAFAGFVALGGLYYKLWLPSEDTKLLHMLTIVTVLGSVTAGVMRPIYYVYTLTLKNKLPCWITIAGGFLNVVSMYVLLKYTQMGVYAIVSTTTVIMLCINLFFNPVYAAYNLKISVKVYYKVIFKHLISAAIMVGGFIGIARVIRPSGWVGLIVSAIIMCISGLIIHVLIMCNMDEKLFLIKKITKRK